MRILVTGGAGYIGSITTRSLLDRGHDVVVIDTLENGNRWAVDKRAQFVEGSVGNREVVSRALQGIDAVMHLAGYIEVAESMTNPEKYFHNNVENGKVLLDCMEEASVRKLVFSSTAAVYGQPKKVPLLEDVELKPINPYGESKLRFEHLIDEYSEKGLVAIRFRYFNVAGAWPDGSLGEAHNPETHIIPNFLRALLSGKHICIFGNTYPTPDGTCVRDYIHVCDLASAHVMALEALGNNEPGGIYNLGNGTGFSNLEIARTCARQAGLTDSEIAERITIEDPRQGDPAVLIASAQKAFERFGWKPKYDNVEEIVSHALAWHTKYDQKAR